MSREPHGGTAWHDQKIKLSKEELVTHLFHAEADRDWQKHSRQVAETEAAHAKIKREEAEQERDRLLEALKILIKDFHLLWEKYDRGAIHAQPDLNIYPAELEHIIMNARARFVASSQEGK